jgi:hypothetical protein
MEFGTGVVCEGTTLLAFVEPEKARLSSFSGGDDG